MSREKRTGKYLGLLGGAVLSTILTACGGQDKDAMSVNHVNEKGIITSNTDSEDKAQELVSDNNQMETGTKEDEIQELMPDDNGWLEIYAEGDGISLSVDMLVGKVTTENILHDTPILYDRAIIDDFVFEWLLLDDEDDENSFSYDGVLIISRQNDPESTQVLHKQPDKWEGWPVSLQSKFEYLDVNFDDVPDLLICTGHHGNQGLITYYCFLQTEDGFVEAPTFTEIANPAVDTENKLILSQWRNTAVSHSWAEYKYEGKGNAYVRHRELREDAEAPEGAQDASDYIWVWTVNGEVIGRSSELSRSEIEDLIYNENSEWRIADDRWRTIYNNGLTADFSIYSEP